MRLWWWRRREMWSWPESELLPAPRVRATRAIAAAALAVAAGPCLVQGFGLAAGPHMQLTLRWGWFVAAFLLLAVAGRVLRSERVRHYWFLGTLAAAPVSLWLGYHPAGGACDTSAWQGYCTSMQAWDMLFAVPLIPAAGYVLGLIAAVPGLVLPTTWEDRKAKVISENLDREDAMPNSTLHALGIDPPQGGTEH